MAMANNVFKPEIWSKVLLRDIMNYGVMLDCVNRNYEGEIKNQGDTVHIQKVGDITINTHDETQPMNHQNLSGTTQILKVDQAQDFMFLVSDIDKVQSNVELMTKYTNKAKKNIVNVKDAYLHALGLAGATNDAGTVAVTAERSQLSNDTETVSEREVGVLRTIYPTTPPAAPLDVVADELETVTFVKVELPLRVLTRVPT